MKCSEIVITIEYRNNQVPKTTDMSDEVIITIEDVTVNCLTGNKELENIFASRTKLIHFGFRQ
jgi:hypothetical protein